MLHYRDDLTGVTQNHLDAFFVGWPRPPRLERRLEILSAATHVGMAWTADPAVDRAAELIGFVTAISDGTFAAYVPLLEVRPQFQGQGIGRTLVERLFARLSNCYMVDLVCDRALEPYYTALGMTALTGMVLRHPERLDP